MPEQPAEPSMDWIHDIGLGIKRHEGSIDRRETGDTGYFQIPDENIDIVV